MKECILPLSEILGLRKQLLAGGDVRVGNIIIIFKVAYILFPFNKKIL